MKSDRDLYGSMIPEPQMVPKLYREWSPYWTANDPHFGSQISGKKSKEWHGTWSGLDSELM